MKDFEAIKSALSCHTLKHIEVGEDGLAAILEKNNVIYAIIASWGGNWEHVSVSLVNRCPIWEEMCWIKDIFWNDRECVMQLHPSKERYVNNHPFCLHLWKPQKHTIPLPPIKLV